MRLLTLITIIVILIISPLHATDFPDIKGWKPISEVLRYNPDNLYEYINGAADQFIAYGFQELLTRDISSEGLQVTVDIYDMGTRLNAFGMFKTESPRDQQALIIGTEAFVSPPYQCLLLKENYYVKVNVYEGRMPRTDVPVYFLDNRHFADREELYVIDGKDFPNNFEAFLKLSKASS